MNVSVEPRNRALSRKAARETIERLRADPVFFCRHALGVKPWAKQIEVLEALRDHDRVAVRSGHGTGKSFISAAAALWFLYAFHPAKVVTTAPTWAQVRLILWSEMRRLHAGARLPLGGRVLEERIKLGDEAFAVGLSTDEAERFQGFHAEHLLVILDEAPGVRDDIWQAAETLLTGRVGKLLAIGNPTRPSGPFYEAFRPGAAWRAVRISCHDSPNAGRDRPLAEYPRLVTRRWIAARAAEWGEDSALYRARVTGDFPEDEASVLFPRAWLEAAAGVSAGAPPRLDDPGEPNGVWRLGVDVARQGADATVFLLRDDHGVRAFETRRGWDTMRTTGRVMRLIDRLALDPARVYVDDVGLGAGVTDRLRELGQNVTAVLASARAADPRRFANRRAENYWRLREALRPRPVSVSDSVSDSGFRFEGSIGKNPENNPGESHRESLDTPLGASPGDYSGGRFHFSGGEPASAPPAFALPDASGIIARELSALSFSLESSGAIRVADKVALRGRLGASPDHADALALTFHADGHAHGDGPLVHFLR